jgi:hypothetical protein
MKLRRSKRCQTSRGMASDRGSPGSSRTKEWSQGSSSSERRRGASPAAAADEEVGASPATEAMARSGGRRIGRRLGHRALGGMRAAAAAERRRRWRGCGGCSSRSCLVKRREEVGNWGGMATRIWRRRVRSCSLGEWARAGRASKPVTRDRF